MDKNTTMLQLFQRFDKACNEIDSLMFIIDAMKRVAEPEIVSYIADDNNVVIGEVYTIKSAGLYTIKGVGSGKFSYEIRNPETLEIIYSGSFDDTAEETKDLYLTYGDICYLHASADAGKTQEITLYQKMTLFGLMSSRIEHIVSRVYGNETKINEIIEDYKDLIENGTGSSGGNVDGDISIHGYKIGIDENGMYYMKVDEENDGQEESDNVTT